MEGQVQGVGVRPWVLRTARALGLTGWVHNASDGVWIEVQGQACDDIEGALGEAPPPIEAVVVYAIDIAEVAEEASFVIRPSEDAPHARPTLPPDLATCDACLAELDTPSARREGYELISCVACGPRYSLAGAPPFDRQRTAMAAFPLCEACQAEYDDPADRRFHAQVTACPRCGPQLSMPVTTAAEWLRGGRIVAIKGSSGFQLLCDAGNEAVVRRLRQLKRRPHKPLAVMTLDAPLRGSECPILLCRPPDTLVLAPSVRCGVAEVGWMGPPTAVHLQLLRAFGGPLVCTSANVSGEPLARVASRVDGLCDAVLDHDRPIWRAADDSVVREVAGEVRVMRRARGYAPRPLPLGADGPPLLALGADLKSAVALGLGDQALLSPHLGSLGSRPMMRRLRAEIASLLEVYDAEPQQVVCDAHPDLISTRVAEELAARWAVPLVRVHHHHAHIAAVCAEHGLDEPVLGLAWDGVGLGDDGGVWGGELLHVHGGRCERRAHLHPFALLGGDAAAREPARVALALLHGAGIGSADAAAALHPHGAELWSMLPQSPRRCTSMGRLFDGIAVLAGVPAEVSWEAQLPLALQQAAVSHGPAEPWPLASDDPLDWRPWVRALVANQEPLERIAARFHATLIAALVQLVEGSDQRVVLGGGCFQNPLLVEGAVHHLGARVVLPRRVPPGDAGIALGQAWIARRLPCA